MFEVLIERFGASESEAEGFAALGFDPKAFLIQLITFLLVFYILKRYVFGRVVDLLEKRRETIEDGVRLTTEIKAEREKLTAEVIEAHKQARKDAEKLISETNDQAAFMLKDAEELAKAKVDKMLADAKKKIIEETDKARRSLERETVELVIQATEAVSREKLDAKKDASLIASALKGQS